MSDKDHSSAEDPALVRAAQAGDMAAFEELVARHRDKIYGRAYSMMRNEEEAIDLSQEAWVKGWQRLKQFQGDASFGTWMTRIVINLCLDQLRKQKRQRTESIEAMDQFLDLKLEEQSLRVAMFNAARDGYLDATGEDYETRAMRAERERFAQSAARQAERRPEREQRANRFG